MTLIIDSGRSRPLLFTITVNPDHHYSPPGSKVSRLLFFFRQSDWTCPGAGLARLTSPSILRTDAIGFPLVSSSSSFSPSFEIVLRPLFSSSNERNQSIDFSPPRFSRRGSRLSLCRVGHFRQELSPNLSTNNSILFGLIREESQLFSAHRPIILSSLQAISCASQCHSQYNCSSEDSLS